MDGGGDYIIEGSPRPSAESQLPGVKFDAMRGSKRPRFPGLFRALFSSQICYANSLQKTPNRCESRPARLSTAHSLSLCKYSFSPFTKRRPVASFAARFHNDGAVAECDSPALLTKHPRASRPHRRRCNSGPRTIRTGPRLGFVD